ncbi:MAG: DNA repair protein RadC [Candidatus Binatia bacterium]|jgi:DNA repair protein RadC
MAPNDISEQLSLPLSSQPHEPAIVDAGDVVVHQRRPTTHKLPAELSDAELLTAVLGHTTALSCEWLTTKHDGFREIAVLTPAELLEHGLTTGAVNRLCAVFEIAKRYGETEFKPGEPLRGSHDVYAHFREHLAAETREHFYVVHLDNKHRKLRDTLVSLGSLTASIVHPRDVFHQIVRCPGVAAVIFCHNHPSGDPSPSKEDIEITRRLREVGDIVGVRVLDHVIIGKGRFVSFVDDGYW